MTQKISKFILNINNYNRNYPIKKEYIKRKIITKDKKRFKGKFCKTDNSFYKIDN